LRFPPLYLDHLVSAPKPFSLVLKLTLNILFILIIFVNSCKVCVYYLCILSNKLHLNQVAHFIIHLKTQTRGLYCKTLQIRNLRENDIFRSKLVSSGLDKQTNILAYNGVRTLQSIKFL